MSDSFTRYSCAILIIIVGFFSYSYNAIHAAPDYLFHDMLYSEQMVTDGIMRHQLTGDSPQLGWIEREGYEKPHLHARKFYREHNVTNEWKPYITHFGIQVHIFSFIADIGLDELWQLHGLASLITSLTVGLFFLVLCRDFSFAAALAFSLTLILCPIFITFGRNLYWFPSAWFLPTLISLFFSVYIFRHFKMFLAMLFLLYAAFLYKFLGGFEYITTIIISTFVPIIYHGFKQKQSLLRITKYLFFTGSVSVIAFVVAAYAMTLVYPNGKEAGFEELIQRAQKRIYSSSPEETAKKSCGSHLRQAERESCIEVIAAGLNSNLFEIVGRQLLVRDIVPVLGSAPLKDETLAELKKAKADGKDALITYVSSLSFSELLGIFSRIVGRIISPLLFLGSLLWFAWHFKKLSPALRWSLLVAFLAPLSWFVIGKAYTYIHYFSSYCLWFLPYIPFVVLVMVEYYGNRKRES